MSTNTRWSAPGSRSTRRHNATRCSRSTDSNWRACPKVNSRRRVPTVDGAYTPPNTVFMPPERSTSISSMLSAPAHIPAISVVSFGAGFADPDLTLDNDLTLKAAALKLGYVTEAEFDRVVDPAQMVKPYVASK